MVFRPKRDQRIGHPDTHRPEPVHAGVTGGAKRHEQFAPVHSGPAVVNMQPLFRPAAGTDAPIPPDDFLSQSGKAAA